MRNAFIPDAVSSSPQTRADVPFLLPPCKYHPDTAAHSTRTSFRRASSRTDLPRRPLIVCRPFFFLVRPTARSVVRTRIYSCVGGGPVHSPGHQTWTPLYPPHEACMRRGCLLLRNISRGMTYTQGAVMAIPFWPALREVTEGGRREKRFGLLPRRGSS